VDLKFFNRYVALLLALIVVTPALVAGYPLPGKDTQANVICTNCLGINFSGVSNKGLPTYPFSAPIVKHVGRLVDSSATKDVQNIGIRTIRAGKVRMQPGASPSRTYIKFGGAVAAYSLDTFFTSKLPGGMESVTSVASVSNSRTKYNSPNEELTIWDSYVYAEKYGTATWPITPDDKQDVLHDFDADDRGYVYSAYSVFGWGITQDGGSRDGSLMPVVSRNGAGASIIAVVKVGSSYYAAVGETAGDKAGQHTVYDVTNASSPTLYANRTSFGFRAWAKNDQTSTIAVIDQDKKLRIYNYSGFANGSSPLNGPATANGGYADVAVDESGNVWAITALESYDATIRKFTPSGSSYTMATLPIGETFKGNLITVGGGYVAVAGSTTAGADVVLFKIEGSTLRRLDLKNYFNKYYHHAPAGYANPPTDFSYVASAYGLQLIKRSGKLYLIYNAHGMGDVYEIEAGDSIGASMRTNNFGTTNPYSKATQTGPFPGDVVKFTATATGSTAYQVSWDFDNAESARNTAQTATGAETSHQFVGYTTSGQITSPKTVTATVVTDSALASTVAVNLKVPVARIGVLGMPTVITGAVTTPITLVLGDSFTDGSDGSVESHVANWSIDGAAAVKRLPNQDMDAGGIGAHTVSMSAAYGRYDANLALETSAYTPSVSNVSYVIRPFTATINAAKSGANAVFSAASRVTGNRAILSAPLWTAAWSLKIGQTVIQTQSADVTLGTVPNFVVPAADVPTGSVVTLTVSIPTSGLVGPAEYTTYTDTMSLSKPDPKITITGCANSGSSCTLTASSLSGASLDGWVYSWQLIKDGVTVGTSTANPYTPNVASPGLYSVQLSAVKGLFDGTAQNSFNAAGALCGPLPTLDQITVTNTCQNGCDIGEEVTFRANLYEYARQDCDVFTWKLGDSANTTKTGTPVKHAYTAKGSYTATLTVTNTSGGTPVVLTTIAKVGNTTEPPPPPPPTCTRPTGVAITYGGTRGCGPGIACQTGERINFGASKNNGDPLDTACDTANWSWGDNTGTSTGRNTTHTFQSAGTYTVSLSVTSSAGNATPVQVVIQVTGTSTGGCTGSATADNLVPEFRGADSRCSLTNGNLCQRGEEIAFDVKAFDYAFQGCDTFLWTFGDGSTSTAKNPTHAFTGSAAEYTVTLRVSNTNNPNGVSVPIRVPFDNAPIVDAPRINISGPVTAGKGVAVTFTATSDIPATNWSWNFGDGTSVDNSQFTRVGTTSTISHVFNKVSPSSGPFSVAVTAKNATDTTDRSTAPAFINVNVTETPVHRFLLPAVIHAGGQAGSAWRTDVQVYYSAPNPSSEPLNMTAEFNGTSTPLLINQSTFIYEDFMRKLVPNVDAQGPVIITTQSKYKPQIWTRTYNVDATGRTFGQFIPAVSLDGTSGAAVTGSADPSKYYLAGLRENARYRTNLGFVNPNATETIANVVVYDDLRIPLTQFTVTMAPFQLVAINGLRSKVSNLPDRPVSLEITVAAGKWLVAYASFIDGISNDPAYIPAVSDAELASADYNTSITPGVGHIGDWRSDVTIYNPDSAGVRFDLFYYDAVGLERGRATDLFLGAGQFKTYDDLLKVTGLWSSAPPDGLGMIRLRTTTPVSRYPMTFSRTYNDKGSGGTFGQGISGFAAARANVKSGKPAIIPGVRSDSNYKTNIGLTNTTALPVNVMVRLLDPNTGATARELPVELAAYQSVVGAFDFGGLATGTFKVEITGGAGEVWAFASIINQGNDPEYVPALSLQ